MSPLLSADLPATEPAPRKLFGRLFFALLVAISAIVGAGAGLILVYSTDLPQVEQLEHYRPSSITELYDDRGRIIGSFALQRRVVASYDEFPPVLRDALVSIEDKDFYRHSGINFWRILGAAYRDIKSGGSAQGASTLTMQLARNLFLSPDKSFHRKIQETLLAIQTGAAVHQAADFHVVCEPDFSRSRHLRFRSGLRILFWEACEATEAGGGCIAGWIAEGADLLLADQPSGTRSKTAQSGDQLNVGRWPHHGAGSNAGSCPAYRPERGPRSQLTGPIFRRRDSALSRG